MGHTSLAPLPQRLAGFVNLTERFHLVEKHLFRNISPPEPILTRPRGLFVCRATHGSAKQRGPAVGLNL